MYILYLLLVRINCVCEVVENDGEAPNRKQSLGEAERRVVVGQLRDVGEREDVHVEAEEEHMHEEAKHEDHRGDLF